MNLSKRVHFLNYIVCAVLVALTITPVYGAPENEGQCAALDNHSLNNYKVYEKCIEQTKELMSIIMTVIHDLYMHENYWKTQKLTPLAYFLSKDPTKWVYRKQEWQKIDSSLAFLEREQEHHAYYLGLFKQQVDEYERDSSYSEKKLIYILELVETFLSYYPHSTTVYRDGVHPESYDQRVCRNAYLMSYYRKNSRRAVAHCSAPNHFQRNWVAYFFGSMAALGVSHFMYKNQSKLEFWALKGIEGLKKYYDEHVSSPIMQSLKFLFQRDRKPLQTPAGVNSCQRATGRATASFFEKRHPELTKEQIEGIVNRTAIGDLDDTYIDWDKTMQELFDVAKDVEGNSLLDKLKLYVVFFQNLSKMLDLARMIDIRIHAKDLQLNKAMLEVEKQINANVFNFEIAAVLPSALVGYVLYKVSTTLFTKIILQKNTYQPLRRSLRHLHMIYNSYAAQNNPLSIADRGFCIYWIEQFKKHSVQLSLGDRKMILDDLAELESERFNATQKLSIIQRMYYNYHFLLPSLD